MTVLCDLDGVVYRGQAALPGAADALRRLSEAGVSVFFITNNSTRTPEEGAAKIEKVTGVEVTADQLLTSSLASVALLAPEDGPVLVVGEEGVRDAVRRAGLAATDDPSLARTVLVGLARHFDYPLLAAAMEAIRSGARFVATNADPTFPTETGFEPGAGSMVAAIATAAGAVPEVAGKPHRAMRELIRSRGVGDAWVVGDRADTDIALARDEPDWRSILVLTGVTTAETADAAGADFVVADLAAAVDLVLGGSQPS